MKKYLIANWKMNGEKTFIDNYFQEFSDNKGKKLNIVFCPAAPYIEKVKNLNINKNIEIGAQDCHYKEKGAFTGDISPAMIKELGANYVILGHSERRQYQHESSELVAQKALAAEKHNLKAVICVGETLTERNNNSYLDVVKQQLHDSIPTQLNKEYIIAYEPVWAIGTGITPKYEEIIEMFELISSFYPNVSILYGGSVNGDNAAKFANIQNMGGFLVGSASLKANEFLKIALSLQ